MEQISSVGVTNVYLQNTAREIFTLKKVKACNFIGVYSCDELLSRDVLEQIRERLARGEHACLISNMSERGEIGSHFIAVCCHATYVTYFDPLALPHNLDVNIRTYIERIRMLGRKRARTLHIAVEQPIQHAHSAFCGLYCLAYIVMCNSTKKARAHIAFIRTFATAPSFFNTLLLENDERVVRTITNAIRNLS